MLDLSVGKGLNIFAKGGDNHPNHPAASVSGQPASWKRVRDATSAEGGSHAFPHSAKIKNKKQKNKIGTRSFSVIIEGVSSTYLTALRLRHLSPEEHAAGRVLNSHKSLQKDALSLERSHEKKGKYVAPRDVHTPWFLTIKHVPFAPQTALRS